jgi:hypothetical protein
VPPTLTRKEMLRISVRLKRRHSVACGSAPRPPAPPFPTVRQTTSRLLHMNSLRPLLTAMTLPERRRSGREP